MPVVNKVEQSDLPPVPAVAPRRLDAARGASRVLFMVLGLAGGAWGVHIPSVKQHYALDEARLSLLLLSIAVGALLALPLAGPSMARWGGRRIVVVAGLFMATMLAGALSWPSWPGLLLGMLVLGAALSLFDVAINAEGTALESLGRRAVMGQLHGMFSLGGMAGAALSAGMLRAGVAPALQLAGFGVLLLALSSLFSGWMLEGHSETSVEQRHFTWPRGVLLLVGLLIFAGMIAEGVMYDWCVLYLKQELGLPQHQAGLGFAVFSLAMALTRFCGDSLRARFSEPLLLGAGAAMAAAAMALLLLVGQPRLALAGFAVVGAGLALVAPILYQAATRVPGVSRAAAIAAVSSIGYSGFLVGPPLVGSLAHASSLSLAMGVVVLAACALALGARHLP